MKKLWSYFNRSEFWGGMAFIATFYLGYEFAKGHFILWVLNVIFLLVFLFLRHDCMPDKQVIKVGNPEEQRRLLDYLDNEEWRNSHD